MQLFSKVPEMSSGRAGLKAVFLLGWLGLFACF